MYPVFTASLRWAWFGAESGCAEKPECVPQCHRPLPIRPARETQPLQVALGGGADALSTRDPLVALSPVWFRLVRVRTS